MPDLSGKVAIVTGCASGIGAATLKRLIADGARILGTDIDAAAGAALCEEAGARFAVQDVSDRALWNGVVREAIEAFGRLDILVNNAGIVTGASIGDVDDDTWDRVIAVNLTGTMAGCRAAIAAMKDNPGGASGAIINIASTTAMAPLPTDVGYSASKGAVRVMSKSVATWCAQQGYAIRCNTVIPGATETGILNAAEEVTPGLKAAVAATSPMKRLADPAETAAAIAFLASDECPFMTGAEMLVDGGALSIHPGF
ncbi:SDR family NAD(P)-dependent oxidoreductase [Parerythrobacter jejuensis]|uniref:SDR family oxidoreductase n=1 Tax=Parerythrobacter jejuensis TaxID=795812 RepID=A0A845AMU1_9SPHN|nr:SDR family oxidoreductase [Parerythrobacter jejuensis]MXP30205.1 SDR family oxidoreductase [Parerythrobacter jejuensis]MXP32965.1 SDR family oxidoreductase [Parerythrobacter jejuensis]